MKKSDVLYVPVTPAGTPIIYGSAGMRGKLVASTDRDTAIANLLKDAAHMPYGTWENFQKRGYTIAEYQDVE